MRLHVVRGFISAAMAVAFFWGLARLPLAEAVALSFIAPIIALLLAGLLLGESIRRTAILASILGFSGVLVILSGQYHAGHRDYSGAAAVLCSALLYSYNIVLMRQQALVAGPVEVTFFQNVMVSLFLIPFAPWFGALPPAVQTPKIAAAALLASCSLLLLAWAYRRAQAQQLAPVEYSALVWAALFGHLFFGEGIPPSTFGGAAMIVTGCIIAARSERQPASPVEAAL
jgi:S-adenosylmethionine uptake transporter